MRKGTSTLRRTGSLALIILLGACATQKSRYDQSKVAKLYHDVTAEFNGYFNAKELLAQSMLELEAQYQENYTEILEIYPYRAAPNPEAVAASLDEGIKKVSVVATLHESSKWVDDCYLLIGKSFYLKQDFESAENALEFFLDEFNPDGTRVVKKRRKTKQRASKQSVSRRKAQSEKERKRLAKEQERERKRYNKELRKKKKQSNRGGGKKSEEAPAQKKTARGAEPSPLSLEEQQRGKAEPIEDPDAGEENPGGLKHRPAYQEGQMWLAKTYVERENYPGVERLLNGLEGNPNLQEEVRDEMPLVWAYYMLRRENYAGAIPHLQKGVEYAKKRVDKARLSFILGQIAERDENYPVAAEYYEKAAQSNHDYALNFNARLSLARAQLQAGTLALDEVSDMIGKMLKDSKNEEFQDQLYFAMARLALHQQDVPLAIEYLQLAAQTSAGNQTQLTETNYLLASLYYESGDYINAKSAYDATLSTMPKTDDRYRQVERLSKNLTDIAMHLQTIELQDSLIRLSFMTDEERRILAKSILQPEPQQQVADNGKIVPAALKGGAGVKMADTKGGDDRGGDTKGPSSPSAGLSALNSNFFAYDQRKLKKEMRDFEGKWGDRPLVDNWRVSALAGPGGFAEDEEVAQSKPSNIITDEQIDRLFSSVPDTDEKKTQAHEAIQNAMLQLGSLYRDKLEDYHLSIEMLEDLLSKYPDTKYRLDAYYQLYLSHLSLGNQSQAESYKNRIISDFAASKYALVLTDPDYLSKQLSEEQKLDRDYQEVYALVNDGEYEEAQRRINTMKASFGTNHNLQPKYSILEAMCIGSLEGREAYVDALKAVIGAYPGTPEEIKARDMLLLLDEYQGSRLNLSTGSSAPSYKAAMDAQHFVLIQVNGMPNSDAQDVKVSISNYNRKYHNLDKLKISSLRFDTKGDQVIILVRSFKDGPAAIKYLNGVQKYPDEFTPAGVRYEAFAVTQNNYREIVKQKSVESYRDFYTQNYQ